MTSRAPAAAEPRGLRPATSPPGQQGRGFCPCAWARAPMAWHGTARWLLRGLASTKGCRQCQEHHAQHLPPAAAQPSRSGETDCIPLPGAGRAAQICGAGEVQTAPRPRNAHRIALCFCLCLFLLPQIAAIINKPTGRSETAWQFSLAARARRREKLPQTPPPVFAGREAAGEQPVSMSRRELKLLPRKANRPRLPHLDVEGPGARYDLKEVVPHQEVTRNSEKETVTTQQSSWMEKFHVYPHL